MVGTKPRCAAYSIFLPLVRTVNSFSTADRTISQRIWTTMATSSCFGVHRLMQYVPRKTHPQTSCQLITRTAYFYCPMRNKFPDSHIQNAQYSTRTSKAAIKAYHKYGLNAFVYNLSEDEREELLQKLQKAAAATKLPEEELNKSVPAPTWQQLRYCEYFAYSNWVIINERNINCFLEHCLTSSLKIFTA